MICFLCVFNVLLPFFVFLCGHGFFIRIHKIMFNCPEFLSLSPDKFQFFLLCCDTYPNFAYVLIFDDLFDNVLHVPF